MFALADCNNFFVSCERAFNPALQNKPVVVLSNNDGCVISRSNEAKALGVKMGAPWHLFASQFKRQGIIALSSNYTLYGNLSNRVNDVLRQFCPALEVYSVDESFLGLHGMPTDELEAHAREIRATVLAWTGIPISIGIAPTKTLAKVANHSAKKNPPLRGVCSLLTPESQTLILEQLPLDEIWGIGHRLASRFLDLGLTTAGQLRQADPAFVRRQFNVITQRLCLELQGIPCLELDMVAEPKKSLICSRSFGRFITEFAEMREAVSTYTCRGAAKLRKEDQVCGQLTVFMRTNTFNPSAPQYHPSHTVTLSAPSADSRKLVRAALHAARKIWRPGYRYKKAGLVFTQLQTPTIGQLSLLDKPDDPKTQKLMVTMDKLNRTYGNKALSLASSGTRIAWAMKSNLRSPSYISRWEELMTAWAG